MTKKEDRHQIILHEVRMHNRVLLTDMARLLHVSKDTVRRDIAALDEAGKLIKVHGGATSRGFYYRNDSTKEIYAFKDKAVIAHKAVKLIEPKSVVLISGGTTNLELVRHLPRKLTATFFTPSLPVALELMEHSQIEVIFIGGKLSQQSQITIGGSALNTLSQIKVDVCFMGTGYLDTVNGLTEFDWEVVQMKKAMINASKKIALLTISEKLNSSQRYRICDIQSINTLITELDKSSEILRPYKELNLEIL